MKNKKIINWAKQHDWCGLCFILAGFIFLEEAHTGERLMFASFSELREWAWY